MDLRLVPAAITAWVVTAAGITWSAGAALAVACAVISVAWGLVWRFGGSRFPIVRVTGIGVLAALVVGAGFGIATALRTDAVRDNPVRGLFGTTRWVTVVPAESAHSTGKGRLTFRAELVRVDVVGASGQVTVFAPVSGFPNMTAGQPARFRARIARPARNDLTVAVCTAVGRPVFGDAGAVQRAAQAVRSGFGAAARAVLPADQAAVLPGLVLGDTEAVSPATTADFRIAGLTHLTAVSGANVTIVCGTVLLCARFIGPRAAVALAALALVGFVIVVQPTPSVLRAAVMGALGLLAVLSARRRQAIPVLAATVITLMVLAPQLAVDVGFALSVSATAALVVLAPRWAERLVARGWPRPLAVAVAVALAAQLVTAPLIAAISGRFSIVSVAANLLVAVVVPPVTVLGTAAAALAPMWPGAAGLLIRFTGPELWWLLRVSDAAAAMPGASVPVPSGWAGLGLIGCASVGAVVLLRRRWFRLCASAALLVGVAWSVSAGVGGP